MKVIIAGGSGLIGNALTRDFLARGHEVVIISRSLESTEARFPQIRVIGWEEKDLIDTISGSDAVINLAGASLAGTNPLKMRWTSKRKADILNSRLKSGEALTKAIRSSLEKPEVFFQASAIGYYGNLGEGIADETSPAGKDFLAEVCLAWENSTVRVEEMGVRRLVGRIGLVFSQEGGLFNLLQLPFRLYIGGQIGDGQQFLSWISLREVVSSIRFLIENPQAQGIYNLTSPAPVTNRDFSHKLGAAMRRPTWLPIPDFLLKLVLGEASTLALDGRQVMPKRLLEAGYQFLDNELDRYLPDLLK